jgi:hypothetical protein
MAVFRFDMAKGQICPKRRKGTVTGPKQRYLSAKIWANTSEGKNICLSLAGSVVRDRVERRRCKMQVRERK